jgi:C-terminal processing protease CtpA/Prc
MRDDSEIKRLAQPLNTSQTLPEPYGVGVLLRKHECGFKIETIAPGGPAWKDGMIQEGDILVGIEGTKTKGKSTHEVSEELSGPALSKVVLSINRHNKSTGVVNVFDVTLQRGPLNQHNCVSDGTKSLFGTGALARIREKLSKEKPFSVTGSLKVAPVVIKDRSADVVGVGLGVRPNTDGSYCVSGIVPLSSAELCGKIRVNDILHSVDGVPVCGKPYETVRDLVQGPPGTQVMIAFLTPEATSDNLLQVGSSN